jgi:hypothetical protein
MRSILLTAAFTMLTGCAFAAEPATPGALAADQIMANVAANQDRTEAARTRYVYLQHIRAVSRKTNGKVMCEEITDSRVSPRAKGSHQDLLKLDGRAWQKNHYIHYATLQDQPAEQKGKEAKTEKEDLDGIDVDLLENLRKDLTDDEDPSQKHEGVDFGHGGGDRPVGKDGSEIKGSKDGLAKGLFPLTSKRQQDYVFQLQGRQKMNGRDVYHVSFRPKDKSDFDWKGEAFIDTAEFEPVVVYTEMSRKIPLAVRTLLGTNLPGLGFSVTYDRQPDGVWFPVSFGTEFRMRVLFFLARDISISMTNTRFEKTHADARILDGVKVVENNNAGTPPSTTTH